MNQHKIYVVDIDVQIYTSLCGKRAGLGLGKSIVFYMASRYYSVEIQGTGAGSLSTA